MILCGCRISGILLFRKIQHLNYTKLIICLTAFWTLSIDPDPSQAMTWQSLENARLTNPSWSKDNTCFYIPMLHSLPGVGKNLWTKWAVPAMKRRKSTQQQIYRPVSSQFRLGGWGCKTDARGEAHINNCWVKHRFFFLALPPPPNELSNAYLTFFVLYAAPSQKGQPSDQLT